MIMNQKGGLNYSDPKQKEIAKKADLITIPNPEGAVCKTCEYFKRAGYCAKPENKNIPVTERMCCNYWENPAQINSWDTK